MVEKIFVKRKTASQSGMRSVPLFNFTSAGLAKFFLLQKWRMQGQAALAVGASVFYANQEKIHEQYHNADCLQNGIPGGFSNQKQHQKHNTHQAG